MKQILFPLLLVLFSGCANFHTHYQSNIHLADNATVQKTIQKDSVLPILNSLPDSFKFMGEQLHEGKVFYTYYSHSQGITIFYVPDDALIRINAGRKNDEVTNLLQALENRLKTNSGLKIEIEEKQIPMSCFGSV